MDRQDSILRPPVLAIQLETIKRKNFDVVSNPSIFPQSKNFTSYVYGTQLYIIVTGLGKI